MAIYNWQRVDRKGRADTGTTVGRPERTARAWPEWSGQRPRRVKWRKRTYGSSSWGWPVSCAYTWGRRLPWKPCSHTFIALIFDHWFTLIAWDCMQRIGSRATNEPTLDGFTRSNDAVMFAMWAQPNQYCLFNFSFRGGVSSTNQTAIHFVQRHASTTNLCAIYPSLAHLLSDCHQSPPRS